MPQRLRFDDGGQTAPFDSALVVWGGTDAQARAVLDAFKAGFKVLEAADADQAVEVLDAAGDVSVLISDVRMPGCLEDLDRAAVPQSGQVCRARLPAMFLPNDKWACQKVF